MLPAIAIHLGTGNILLLISLLVLVAILISRLGARFGVPGMLLFLIVGMLAGPDGLGIEITNHELGEFLGHLGITIILLSGGLSTSYVEARPVLKKGLSLSTLGLFITALATGFFIFYVLGDRVGQAGSTLLGCFLMAAVMSSTDSPTVFSVLRSRRIHLRQHLDPVLELESGTNDPMGYTLTLLLVAIINSTHGLTLKGGSWLLGSGALLLMLIWQIGMGIGIGIGVGFGARWLVRRIRMQSGPLYSILILAAALLANGLVSLT